MIHSISLDENELERFLIDYKILNFIGGQIRGEYNFNNVTKLVAIQNKNPSGSILCSLLLAALPIQIVCNKMEY